MSPRRRPSPGLGGDRRRTAAELDALLDGGRSGDPRLDEVLSAARAPAHASELATPAPAVDTGLETAGRSGPSRSRRVLTRLGAATLVTKAVVGGVSAVVVGAAAVAGATHHLPGQTRPRPPVVNPSPAASDSTARSSAPSTSAPRSSRSAAASPSVTTSSPSVSASPSGASDIPALCRAWLALPPSADAARRGPRFVVLVQAAGGITAVTAYCQALPPVSASGTSSGTATEGSPSSSKPAPPSRTPRSSKARPTPPKSSGTRSSGSR